MSDTPENQKAIQAGRTLLYLMAVLACASLADDLYEDILTFKRETWLGKVILWFFTGWFIWALATGRRWAFICARIFLVIMMVMGGIAIGGFLAGKLYQELDSIALFWLEWVPAFYVFFFSQSVREYLAFQKENRCQAEDARLEREAKIRQARASA